MNSSIVINKILELNEDKYYIVDVLVEYLYAQKQSSYKTTLWSSFGDIIVENLKPGEKYYLIEKQTAKEYDLLKEPVYFSIKYTILLAKFDTKWQILLAKLYIHAKL